MKVGKDNTKGKFKNLTATPTGSGKKLHQWRTDTYKGYIDLVR